jgi:hypothetical protein
MVGDVSSLKIVGLSVAIALGATACSGSSVPARDASAERVRVDGIAEAQPSPPATPPAAGAADSDGMDGSQPGRDPHRMRRVLGWITLSIGIEASVLAAVTSALIEHQKGVRDDGCNAQKVCDAAGFAAVGTIDTLIPWNTASWFVGAAGLAAGTALLLTSQPESARRTAITLSPNSSGLGLGVRSTF